jgi:hypothetical protein
MSFQELGEEIRLGFDPGTDHFQMSVGYLLLLGTMWEGLEDDEDDEPPPARRPSDRRPKQQSARRGDRNKRNGKRRR